MRIGVPLSVDSPEAGGGYTFERDVAEALLRCASESRHEFTIFTRGAHLQTTPKSPVRIVQLSRNDVLNWKWRSLRSRIAGFTWTSRPGHGSRPRGTRAWMEKCLMAHGTEFVWNLAPGTPTFELPYIAMVWDLQHRLQPFFPEVSADSEWERREDFFRALLQRAAFVITGNSTGQDEIERFYQVPSPRIRRLPHPTPHFARTAARAEAAELSKWGIEPGYLFYPAQFWPHKNHVGLLRAVRLLREKHGLSPVLVLVGSDKSNLQYVRTLAEQLGVESQVRVLGFVSRGDLATLYRHAQALVYPTFFGPENLPPLEAMALECPVIASRVAGADEQLGDAALLIDPRDPADMAAAIARLFRDANLRGKLIDKGLLRSQKFTSDDFVRGVFGMLDEFESVRMCWDKQAG